MLHFYMSYTEYHVIDVSPSLLSSIVQIFSTNLVRHGIAGGDNHRRSFNEVLTPLSSNVNC